MEPSSSTKAAERRSLRGRNAIDLPASNPSFLFYTGALIPEEQALFNGPPAARTETGRPPSETPPLPS